MKEHKEFWEEGYEEGVETAPPPPRAPAWLAVMRIVCVLGMAFGISFGLFMLLLPHWLLAAGSLLSAIPFLVVMRYLEKFAQEHPPEEVQQ